WRRSDPHPLSARPPPAGQPARRCAGGSAGHGESGHSRPATGCGGRCQCSWMVLLVVIVWCFLCSPGNIAPLGTSSTSSMGGLVQASVLASSLAGRAGARPSQGNARLRHPRNRLSEAQQRTGEHHSADQGQGEERFPDGFQPGATVENGLTELDEMGGG